MSSSVGETHRRDGRADHRRLVDADDLERNVRHEFGDLLPDETVEIHGARFPVGRTVRGDAHGRTSRLCRTANERRKVRRRERDSAQEDRADEFPCDRDVFRRESRNERMRRRDVARTKRIEVERGLLQRDFSGIDIARVQSVEIRQSLIRRMIGYCEISLGRINVGSDEAGKQNNSSSTRGLVVHPFVKIDRVDEIIDGLAPELNDRPRIEELAKLPAPAFRRSILRRCVWYNVGLYVLIALGILVVLVNGTPGGISATAARGFYGMVGIITAICVVYTIGRAVGAVFWARGSGYTWNRSYLMLFNDGLSVERVIIPRQKIQSGSTRSNPFQRRLSLTGIAAMTAAGTRSTSVKLIDVPDEVGDAYLEWLKPRH